MKLLLTTIFIVLSATGKTQSAEKFIINFDFDKYNITAQAKQKLDSFLRSTTAAEVQKIELYGHCDSVGNNAYNDRLSIKRVTAVKDYLSKTLPQTVFESVNGFGKRRPLNNNADEEERYLNRRVEVIVQKINAPAKTTAPKQERSLSEKIKDSTTKAGTNIILDNMNFYGGRHLLLPQSLPKLKELLRVLQENPSLEIEIQGHICCTFGAEDGLDIDNNTNDLSVNRAKAIYDYLVGNGIDAHRLSYKGFGHRHPLVYPEDTEEKRTTNRRVEIKIIKK